MTSDAPRSVPEGGEGLVGVPLAKAEQLLRERGKEFGVYRPQPPGSAGAMPFKNKIMLHIDLDEVVTDVSIG